MTLTLKRLSSGNLLRVAGKIIKNLACCCGVPPVECAPCGTTPTDSAPGQMKVVIAGVANRTFNSPCSPTCSNHNGIYFVPYVGSCSFTGSGSGCCYCLRLDDAPCTGNFWFDKPFIYLCLAPNISGSPNQVRAALAEFSANGFPQTCTAAGNDWDKLGGGPVFQNIPDSEQPCVDYLNKSITLYAPTGYNIPGTGCNFSSITMTISAA